MSEEVTEDQFVNIAGRFYRKIKGLKAENKQLLEEIGKLPNTVATYNRGYINGYKDAPKPNPDICQVCGGNKKGMEHSCQ